jgi:histidyl-tRNA synthetase
VCGGGRYDGLIEQLGGKGAPAVGFGLGIERLLLLADELDLPMPSAAADVYAIVPPGTPLPPVIVALEALRTAGLNVVQHAGGAEGAGSMKSQFKKADASGARHALIFGEDELARGQVTVKALRDGSGAQAEHALADVAQWAATLQSVA